MSEGLVVHRVSVDYFTEYLYQQEGYIHYSYWINRQQDNAHFLLLGEVDSYDSPETPNFCDHYFGLAIMVHIGNNWWHCVEFLLFPRYVGRGMSNFSYIQKLGSLYLGFRGVINTNPKTENDVVEFIDHTLKEKECE